MTRRWRDLLPLLRQTLKIRKMLFKFYMSRLKIVFTGNAADVYLLLQYERKGDHLIDVVKRINNVEIKEF